MDEGAWWEGSSGGEGLVEGGAEGGEVSEEMVGFHGFSETGFLWEWERCGVGIPGGFFHGCCFVFVVDVGVGDVLCMYVVNVLFFLRRPSDLRIAEGDRNQLRNHGSNPFRLRVSAAITTFTYVCFYSNHLYVLLK